MKFFRVLCLLAVLSGVFFTGVEAGVPSVPEGGESARESSFEKWWKGRGLTGDWWGLRNSLSDRGLAFNGKYYGAFFGIVDSQNGSRGVWDEGIEFGAEQNFGKLLGLEGLEGVKGFGQARYRDSSNLADPNQVVGGSSMFNPSNWISGTQFRILNFGLEASSGSLLGGKDLVVVRGGWLQPQREFIDQPLSKLFLNNAVNSAKGIGGNIPFSSSASTWGGTLNLRPVEWHYAKAGLFMAYPKMTDSNNHGLAYQGFAPDPSQNGLWMMAETGFTPKLGAAELPGKYAFGGYYYGAEQDSFNGTSHYGQFGFYWQMDQMLFREGSGGGSGEADFKSDFKSVESAPKLVLSEQGLRFFSLFTFAPSYNNLYPFYFHTGLVYEGLLPGRDKDQTIFSLAYGNYSYQKMVVQEQAGKPAADSTMFLEWGYRVQVNRWSFVQPFAQYVIRPNGTDEVKNAGILGVYVGLNF